MLPTMIKPRLHPALARWLPGLMVCALLGVSVPAGNCLRAADEPRQAEPAALPTGLEVVAADGPGFLTVNLTEVFADATVKEFFRLLDKEQPGWREHFKQESGLELSDLERATVLLPPPPLANVQAVVVLTTRKALDRQALRKGPFVRATEKKASRGKTYFEEGQRALGFLGERVYVYGASPKVVALLDRPATRRMNPTLEAALRRAARQPAVAMVNLAAYGGEMKDSLRGETEPLLPLFQARTAWLMVVSGADTRADLHLTYATEVEARDGEKAARAGLALAQKYAALGREKVAEAGEGKSVPEMQKWFTRRLTTYLKNAEAGLKTATVEPDGPRVKVAWRSKSGVGENLAFVAGFFWVATGPSRAPDAAEKPPAAARP